MSEFETAPSPAAGEGGPAPAADAPGAADVRGEAESAAEAKFHSTWGGDRERTRAENFFRQNAIALIRVSVWSGHRVISDTEMETFMGHENLVKFKAGEKTKGSKMLVPKSFLKQAEDIKRSAERWLKARSLPVGNGSSLCFVPNDLKESVFLHMVNVVEPALKDAVDKMVETYDGVRSAMVKKFSAETGLSEEVFEADYPSAAMLRRKFGVTVNLFASPAAIELSGAVSDAYMKRLSDDASRFAEQIVGRLRGTVAESINAFLSVMDGKEPDQKVNARSVKRVREMIGQFKMLNVAGDDGMDRMLQEISSKMDQIPEWTADEVRASGLMELMGRAHKRAMDEVEKAQVVSVYLGELDQDPVAVSDPGPSGDDAPAPDIQMDIDI